MNEKVMVAGHICLDICPLFPHNAAAAPPLRADEIFVPGTLIPVDDAVLSTGGAVSNTGLALACLGADVTLNAKVGDDVFGRIIRDIVGHDRAAAFQTAEAGVGSSYSIVLSPPGLDRIFCHNTGANDTFGADDVDLDAAARCRLFHFGYPTLMERFYAEPDQLAHMFEAVRRRGVTTSLDTSLPDPAGPAGHADWHGILRRALPFVDIFLPSLQEIALMLDRPLFEKRQSQAPGGDAVFHYTPSDLRALAERLIDMGVRIVVLKAGVRGLYLRTASREALADAGPAGPADIDAWAERELWAPSCRVDRVVNASGAGDSTIAGFLAAMLRGFSPEESLRIAALLGCQNVQAPDALSGIRQWNETLDELRQSPSANPLDVNEPGWTRRPHELLRGPRDGG